MSRHSSTGRHVSAKRCGFTLIELITAMLSTTVLVAALAATVSISTKLLEVPPYDENLWRDREIADRLASDLRYATDVNEDSGFGFEITKPDVISGSPEIATYESYLDGLTRQVGSGPLIKFDPDSPEYLFQVDGYSAPTFTESPLYVRLRSSSQATTSFATDSLDIALPPGGKADDLVLLCISAKTPSMMDLSDEGWQMLQMVDSGDLGLAVLYQNYGSASPTTTITVSPDASIAAAMLALEDVESSSPINWSATNSGYAWSSNPSTHPKPLETTGFNRRQLNVQIYAAEQEPWLDGTLGLAGFADAVLATSSPGDSSSSSSLGIAIRNGATPSLSTTPRLYHQQSGEWLQVAVRLEANP